MSQKAVDLAAVLNRTEDLVRTFIWRPQAKHGKDLAVTVRYRAQQAVEEDVKREKARMLERPRYHVELADVQAEQEATNEVVNRFLSKNIVKIQLPELDERQRPRVDRRVPLLAFAALVRLDERKFAELADAYVALDPTVEDKAEKELAERNIFTLMSENADFKNWVVAVASDVSLFQDATWSAEVKNSGNTAATSSA
jgi:hypothetical protein